MDAFHFFLLTKFLHAAKPPTAPGQVPKPVPYNPSRLPCGRAPPPARRRSRRRPFCLCCFWLVLIITLLVLLAAICACVAYLIYSPKRPAFTVTSVKISKFNLTNSPDDMTHITSSVNVILTARNPNKKIMEFDYDQVDVNLYSSQKAVIANGSFPSFISYRNAPNVLRSTLRSSNAEVDADLVAGLRLDLNKKKGVPMKIEMNTQVVSKIGKYKTRKVGIRVICDDIKGILPKGKSVLALSITNEKCKVEFRIKIWKFTF